MNISLLWQEKQNEKIRQFINIVFGSYHFKPDEFKVMLEKKTNDLINELEFIDREINEGTING